MKIWIDDIFNFDRLNLNLVESGGPWVWVKTVEEFKEIVDKHKDEITMISFDNDLGVDEFGNNRSEGKEAFLYIEEKVFYGEMPSLKYVNFHSDNSAAVNLLMTAKNFLKKYDIETTSYKRLILPYDEDKKNDEPILSKNEYQFKYQELDKINNLSDDDDIELLSKMLPKFDINDDIDYLHDLFLELCRRNHPNRLILLMEHIKKSDKIELLTLGLGLKKTVEFSSFDAMELVLEYLKSSNWINDTDFKKQLNRAIIKSMESHNKVEYYNKLIPFIDTKIIIKCLVEGIQEENIGNLNKVLNDLSKFIKYKDVKDLSFKNNLSKNKEKFNHFIKLKEKKDLIKKLTIK